MLIEKLVRVEVDVDGYIDEFGDDPYGDGRPVEDAIEVDVEQAILEGIPAEMALDVEVEVG